MIQAANPIAAENAAASLHLSLQIHDPNVVSYLASFPDEQTRNDKAVEAIKVGVIAIRSASPTLDTTVVQQKFVEMQSELKDFLDEFTTALRDDLQNYFKDTDGVVPKSINVIFGENGKLGRTFHDYFDPAAGRLGLLMQQQIGPASSFGKAIDSENKNGIISQIEKRVQKLVDDKFTELMAEFSLETETSAMCRLQKMLSDSFFRINESLGIQAACAAEAERGHLKGLEFEECLYACFAELGRRLGDETELVRQTPGAFAKRKTGDYVATLGKTSGAPGARLVVEVKNKQKVKFKDAIAELKEAKENRLAACGVFVFAKGCEPTEVGDLRCRDDDFYCTVAKEQLDAGQPPLYFEIAYTAARALVVAAARKAEGDELDLQQIKDHIDALLESAKLLGDIITKAHTAQAAGEAVEKFAKQLKVDLNERLQAVLEMVTGS